MALSTRLSSALWLAGCLASSGCMTGSKVHIVDTGTAQNNVFQRLFHRTDARIQYEQVIDEVPDKLTNPAQLSLSYAKLMEEAGNTTEAESHYQKVIAEQPQNIEAIVGLGRVQQATARIDLAEQSFHKALRIDPRSACALHGLGQFYGARDRWDEAVELLNKAVVESPNERAYRYDLAVALVRTDNVESALPHFIRTVGDAEAHYNVGLILHQQGKLVESEQQFRMALSRKPDLEQAQYWLNTVMREQGQQSASRTAASGPNHSPSLPAVSAAGHSLNGPMPLALAGR